MNDTRPGVDHDAERAVLGAMLMDNRCIGDVQAILTSGDFHNPKHEQIYVAVATLVSRQQPVDPIAVADQLRRTGDLNHIGGLAYLHQLINGAPVGASATWHADIVRRHAQLRTLAAISTRLHQAATADGTDLDDVPDLYATAIKELEAGLADAPSENIPTTDDAFDDTITGIENPPPNRFVPTGIHDLDALLGGWSPGEFIIVAARPAIGKSTLARTFIREAAIRQRISTLLVSLEMSLDENMRCLISAEAKVELHHIKHNTLTEHQWARIASRAEAIRSAPLRIDASGSITLGHLRHNAHEIRRKHGLGLIVLDYLQLVDAPAAENRQQAVSALSRGLKSLAAELEIPIIALSQLNRGPESRADKRPVMSDLRESGSLEQDANVVILLHREDAYQRDSPRAGEVEVIVEKNRSGPTASITCAFQGHYSRVVDMAKAA